MYPECFHRFPGTLAPSVRGALRPNPEKSIPTDSTLRKKLTAIKLTARRKGGQARGSGRGLLAGNGGKGLPLSEEAPIAITKASFPRVQHPAETRVAPPPPCHQKKHAKYGNY